VSNTSCSIASRTVVVVVVVSIFVTFASVNTAYGPRPFFLVFGGTKTFLNYFILLLPFVSIHFYSPFISFQTFKPVFQNFCNQIHSSSFEKLDRLVSDGFLVERLQNGLAC
jgi:hypothetical protein